MDKVNNEEIKIFNIITLGDSGVGKTSIINRYIANKFEDNISSTLGMNFSYKELNFNNKDKIKLKLVDTAGQEKYRALTKSYFKNVHVVLFVFSVDDNESFNSIKYWMKLFNDNNKEDIPKYLIATKNDLEIKVDRSSIEEFIMENKIPFKSTSAKENNNIEELFEEIGKQLYIDYRNNGDKGQNNINIKIIKKNHKGGCCLFKFAQPDM